MVFLSKNAIFRPNIELEAIARQPVEASREVICAYFGNIGRNSGYFLLPIFWGSHPKVQLVPAPCMSLSQKCDASKDNSAALKTKKACKAAVGKCKTAEVTPIVRFTKTAGRLCGRHRHMQGSD